MVFVILPLGLPLFYLSILSAVTGIAGTIAWVWSWIGAWLGFDEPRAGFRWRSGLIAAGGLLLAPIAFVLAASIIFHHDHVDEVAPPEDPVLDSKIRNIDPVTRDLQGLPQTQ